jgi:predicted nuclease of predicted toxin-antitoxin system
VIRLLLDENLSEAILRSISTTYPGSAHVRLALRPGASDEEVWAFARDHGFELVTRDEDFERLSAMRDAPPKVVWLALHNAINAEVASALRQAESSIDRFVNDEAGRAKPDADASRPFSRRPASRSGRSSSSAPRG